MPSKKKCGHKSKCDSCLLEHKQKIERLRRQRSKKVVTRLSLRNRPSTFDVLENLLCGACLSCARL